MKNTFLGLIVYFASLLVVCLTMLNKEDNKYTGEFMFPTAMSLCGVMFCVIGYLNI